MALDPETGIIRWRIHLASSPERVYSAISTDQGRSQFWAESTTDRHQTVRFIFPNGMTWDGDVLATRQSELFEIDYFGSRVRFTLQDDGAGGTELTLEDHGAAGSDQSETAAGWVSVLLALKAFLDHGIDLRNHDPGRTWDQGYADN